IWTGPDSKGPISPRSEAHHLSLDGRLSISVVFFYVLPSRHTHSINIGLGRVFLKWAWAVKLTDFASPQTRYPNLMTFLPCFLLVKKMSPRPCCRALVSALSPFYHWFQITMCCLVGEGWPSTSHYLTKFQLSNSIGKAQSSLVLISL
ncbi:hypothetical protein HID58_060881, partial [Brassica napus]